MFGARDRDRADLSWLLPAAQPGAALPTALPGIFPDGVPRLDSGPDPFGYDPPFVPPQVLSKGGRPGTLSQRCLNALQVTHKSPADVDRVQGLMPILRHAAATSQSMDPRLLAAIALHESAGKNIAEIGRGKGLGVFQLTNQPITRAQAFDIPFAANYAAGMLVKNRRTVSRRYPNFTPEQLNQAMVAAYNKGVNNKRFPITSDPAPIDAGTDHNNYGQNVLDLVSCF